MPLSVRKLRRAPRLPKLFLCKPRKSSAREETATKNVTLSMFHHGQVAVSSANLFQSLMTDRCYRRSQQYGKSHQRLRGK